MVDGVRLDPEDAAAMPTRAPDDMARIASGTFRMGSDVHYPEERPAHRVTVDAFWIGRHAVTNADFATFVAATGYVTFTERPLDPALNPGARPELLTPGCAVFRVPGRPARPRDAELRSGPAWSADPAQSHNGRLVLVRADFCQRYRPAARYPRAVDRATSHIGFRCGLRAA
jgi:formylglycine-generating enzyme required for sulfatase activity